jgi:hypothetical protein
MDDWKKKMEGCRRRSYWRRKKRDGAMAGLRQRFGFGATALQITCNLIQTNKKLHADSPE